MGEAKRRRERGEAPRAPKVRRIESAHLAYFRRVSEQARQLPMIEAKIMELQDLRSAIRGAKESFGAFLGEEYGLDTMRQRIDEETGAIIDAPDNVVPITQPAGEGQRTDAVE